jgi:signal transduction histidine kinase
MGVEPAAVATRGRGRARASKAKRNEVRTQPPEAMRGLYVKAVRRLRRRSDALAELVETGALQMRQASHDLKTPLVSMKGYVDLMLQGLGGTLTPTMQRYLDRVASAIERQRSQIDALLSPLTGGVAPIELGRLVEDAVRPTLSLGERLGVGVTVRPPPPWVALLWEPRQLSRALTRVLRAALHASDRGTRLEVGLEGEKLVFTVRQHPAGDRPSTLFDPAKPGAQRRWDALAQRAGLRACLEGDALRLALPYRALLRAK